MRLSELKTGEKGVIVKVLGHGGFRKRIVEMGFIRGKIVTVLLNAPLQDPVKYKIMGYEISLRHSEAAMIEIISTDEAFREQIEPGAAPWKERLSALKALHDAGCKTWVSIEPYPTPNIIKQDLIQLLEKVNFVDRIIFGRMNYNKVVTAYSDHKHFFNTCATEVIAYCDKLGIDYHIKNGTITPQCDTK